jgi:hypothetical protein
LVISFGVFAINTVSAMPNPWTDCSDDIYCASSIAGFNFPLRVKNYSVRAMKDMIELTFSIDKKRTVTVRKSVLFDGDFDKYGIKDISGNYNKYPINKTIWINKAVPFNVRGDKNKFYVVNFAAETGYYSIVCNEGLKLKDIKYFYKLLEEAEAPRHSYDESNNYTIEELQNLRRTDGIVEPVYTQDCFPRTLQKKGVTKNCFERANLGQDVFCSASEIKMIKEYYKKGQNSDPLNDGNQKFCAK